MPTFHLQVDISTKRCGRRQRRWRIQDSYQEEAQIGTTGSSGQALRQTSENEHFRPTRDKTELDHSVTFYVYFQNILCVLLYCICMLKKCIN